MQANCGGIPPIVRGRGQVDAVAYICTSQACEMPDPMMTGGGQGMSLSCQSGNFAAERIAHGIDGLRVGLGGTGTGGFVAQKTGHTLLVCAAGVWHAVHDAVFVDKPLFGQMEHGSRNLWPQRYNERIM